VPKAPCASRVGEHAIYNWLLRGDAAIVSPSIQKAGD
jgi:hypothetical protein